MFSKRGLPHTPALTQQLQYGSLLLSSLSYWLWWDAHTQKHTSLHWWQLFNINFHGQEMRVRTHTQFKPKCVCVCCLNISKLCRCRALFRSFKQTRLSGSDEGFSSEDEELITVCLLQHHDSSCQGLKAGPAPFCSKTALWWSIRNGLKKFCHRFCNRLRFVWRFFKVLFFCGCVVVLSHHFAVEFVSFFCFSYSVPFRVFAAGFLLKYSANFCSN